MDVQRFPEPLIERRMVVPIGVSNSMVSVISAAP